MGDGEGGYRLARRRPGFERHILMQFGPRADRFSSSRSTACKLDGVPMYDAPATSLSPKSIKARRGASGLFAVDESLIDVPFACVVEDRDSHLYTLTSDKGFS